MGKKLSDAEARAELQSVGLTALEPYATSHSPWLVRCDSCGRDFRVRLSKVRHRGDGCGTCGRAASAQRRRDAHAQTAEETMRAAGVEPLEPYPGALKPWQCRCTTCDREVAPRYANIQQGNKACVYCAGKRVDPDHAVTVMRDAGLSPVVPFPGSAEPWKCVCVECGRDVSPAYTSIASGQGGCGYCVGRRVSAEEAVELALSRGVKPLEPYSGVHTPWRCQCMTCGREVRAWYTHLRVGKTQACGYCAGRSIDADEAVRVMRASNFEPLAPFPGSRKPWPVQCTVCGRAFSTLYSSVASGRGCRYCKHVMVDADEAADLMRSVGLEPLAPYPGSHEPWLCRCEQCGRETKARYHHVRARGSGCGFCGKRGPDLTAPGVLYLIRQDELDAYKVGVARHDSQRLRQHYAEQWTVVRMWNFPAGETAYQVEAAVLAHLRDDLALPPYLNAELMPQGGWTETVGQDDIDLEELIGMIEQAVQQHKHPDV